MRPHHAEASPRPALFRVESSGHVGVHRKLVFPGVSDGAFFGHTNSYLVR